MADWTREDLGFALFLSIIPGVAVTIGIHMILKAPFPNQTAIAGGATTAVMLFALIMLSILTGFGDEKVDKPE